MSEDRKSGVKPGSDHEPTPPDTTSLSSGSTVGVGSRLINLAQKGEWNLMEQVIRSIEKGSSELLQADEDTGVTPLMLSVRENKLVVVERLLDLGVNVNEKAKDGRTALHFAATYAKDDICKILVNKKADASITGGAKDQLALHMACMRTNSAAAVVNLLIKVTGKDCRLCQDRDGAIPLILATESGNIGICKELLSAQAEQQVRIHKKDNGDTVLHIACRRKDAELSRLIIESGATIDAKNEEGHSALHVSACEGDEPMIKYLCGMKANVNITDKLDRSPLHIAAEKGHTNAVELLIDKYRANISARTKDGSTLMHVASQHGHPSTALAFLKKGVPLLMPNKDGALCLHAAAKRGHTAVVKSLLLKGALVDSNTKDRYTALHIAVEYGKPLVVQTLLGFGAQVELKGGKAKETPLHIAARVKEGEKCAEMLIKSGADVNAVQENGETALHIAARYGQLNMVTALLAEGADATWPSHSGETPLHIAVRHCHFPVVESLMNFITSNKSRKETILLVNQQNNEGETALHYGAELSKTQIHQEFEDTDIVRLMLDQDGDPQVATTLTMETPLHYCARAGNSDVLLEVVKHISQHKLQVAVNKQAQNGWSPLLVACEHGHLEIVKILLQNHARVDVFDEHGKAALHLASENGHEKVADVLLWHKAFVNAKSKLGITPLHLATQNGYNALVKLLIQTHSAAIDALSLAKKTPLHLAAENGKMEVCNTLLKMKADANATDVHGQTPLHLAAENDHSDVVKLFLKHRPELVTMASTNGMTCAHIAASKGSVAVIKELMRFNKTVVTTARNRTNESTALHLACAGGHREVVRVLLEAGASASSENADGMAAVHLAAKYGHTSVMDVLKDHISIQVPSTKTGLTALHVGAHFGKIDFVREMLTKIPATIKSEVPQVGEAAHPDVSAAEHGLTPLHLAAQTGHEGTVRLLLNSPGVQADIPTFVQGSIPLHLAAQGGHTAVVSLLLSKSTKQIHVKDKRGRTGLHLAAANGHIDLVALMIGQGADINCYDKNGWTPLHLAAKAGHLDVVRLLIESGASTKYETKDGKVAICYAAAANHGEVLSYLMSKDHNTQQLMDDKKFVFDLMQIGKMNNNKSLQEFILVSPAPVDTAAKMSKHFRLLATKEKERSKDLLLAGDFCETMATDLMAVASSWSSAGLLLRASDCRNIPFLDVLIECEQKMVVSHPAVQKYLSDVWMGSLQWSSWKIVLFCMTLLVIPPIWVIFSLPLKHRYAKVPVVRFMTYLVSHLYLIALFFITIVVPLIPIWESGSLLPHSYEWILLAWLSGMLVSELTNPGDRAGLGWLKVIVISICAMGLFVHVLAFAFTDVNRLTCLYIRNQFFAFALLLCLVQLLDFLSFHHLFGPWAIIIRDLMKDLIRFLVILAIFMLGFTLHLAAIYQPVLAPFPPDPSLGDGQGAGGAIAIISPLDTFELLFFALFGLVEPENLPPVHRNPIWSITLVKAVFGIYLIVTLIVLINLLIAMMSDTYQRIQAQSDTEWKFGRAKLIRNMNKTSATPAPLNLFTKLFTYCRAACKHRGKLCSGQAAEFEEDVDVMSDTHSMDVLHSSGQFMRGFIRRNTQIVPDADGFLRPQHHRGPLHIDEVVDWENVVTKYLTMQGMDEGSITSAPTKEGPRDQKTHKVS